MTTTTASSASFAPESPPSGLSFASRLRRLSQLRTHHTHNPNSPHSPTQSSRSNRYSLTRAVGLALSPHSPVFDTAADHLTHDLQPTVSTRSAPEPRDSHASGNTNDVGVNHREASGSSSSSEDRSDVSSHSSRSTPANEADIRPSDPMRLRVASTDPSMAQQLSSPPTTSGPADESHTSPPATSESYPNGSTQQDSTHMTVNATPSSIGPAKARSRPTIRLIPHHAQYSRPSLPFTPISRTMPDDDCIIKVGRYSERDGVPVANPSKPSAAPVGFKSKVVSRKHCEFSFVNGQWHIKDVGSSSGTFLNHMRLSQPNTPSRLYAVRDGDVIQLGIDFRGGEEMIFRCVRIRIECNRTWQRGPNEFNKNTESLINNLGKGADADYKGCRECSICLNSVLRPYQCLFMAACAHVWHYKCIRRLIHTPEYPMFQCPNCRAYTDLSADVDDTNDMGDEDEDGPVHSQDHPAIEAPCASLNAVADQASRIGDCQPDGQIPLNSHRSGELEGVHTAQDAFHDAPDVPSEEANPESDDSLTRNAQSESIDEIARTPNIDIPRRNFSRTVDQATQNRLAASTGASPIVRDNFEDCPLTPRNDLGPLALDGRAGRL
uniref:Dma1 n=1 Tax=Coccidioides posadasii RMSCC 3488 TaxID=454284 RepID=A0A0J6FFE4_COCPO|nr:dma1 [Coccidioides posadasii RMSCC 3488]